MLEAIKIDSKNYFALDDLAVFYRRNNEIDKAIEYYNKSIKVNPKGLVVYMNLGVAYGYKNDVENAEKTYKKLIQIHPDYPEGYYGLGTINFYKGQYDEALKNMEMAKKYYKELDGNKYYELLRYRDTYIKDSEAYIKKIKEEQQKRK